MVMDQIRGFLTSWSSGSSCPFDPLGAIGLVSPSGLVDALYSAGLYSGLAGPVSESYVLLPKLGLLGLRSHSRVSKGVAMAGISAKVSNHLPSGCLGMTNGSRAVTYCQNTENPLY